MREKLIDLRNVPSEENTADVLTKALKRILHGRKTAGMGMKLDKFVGEEES